MRITGRIPADLPDGTSKLPDGTYLEPGGRLTIDGFDGVFGTIVSIEVVDGFLVVEAEIDEESRLEHILGHGHDVA